MKLESEHLIFGLISSVFCQLRLAIPISRSTETLIGIIGLGHIKLSGIVKSQFSFQEAPTRSTSIKVHSGIAGF